MWRPTEYQCLKAWCQQLILNTAPSMKAGCSCSQPIQRSSCVAICLYGRWHVTTAGTAGPAWCDGRKSFALEDLLSAPPPSTRCVTTVLTWPGLQSYRMWICGLNWDLAKLAGNDAENCNVLKIMSNLSAGKKKVTVAITAQNKVTAVTRWRLYSILISSEGSSLVNER